MKDSDPRQAPPIPPRRLKRKKRSIVGPTDGIAETATTSGIRLEQRPRLPPPPPPQRGLPRGGIRPQLLPRSDVTGNISPGSYSAENCHSISINGDKLLVDGIEGVKTSLSTFGTTPRLPSVSRRSGKKASAEEPQRRKREKEKISRPNDYPPLFFTLQDFQDVMSDVENSYSRTLKNMTSFEPTPKPRSSKIPITDLPGTPEKGDVLFRVTTTNVPFEKSLPEWTDVANDPNHFIFEDYVDRRKISSQRKSKLVLFGDDTFDRDDEDQTISTSHTASRVRFLVDSPTRDENCDKIAELDSLQNIESLPLDFSPSKDSMSIEKSKQEENEDEFGDVPFDSLLNDTASSLCVDPSEDSTSSKTDFQTILVTAMVEPVPFVQGMEKPSENGRVIDSNIESVREKDDSHENVIFKDEDICDDEKGHRVGVQDLELDVKCEAEKSADSLEILDNRKEEKRKIMGDETFRDLIEVENNVDKSPFENVRRNSFLMNMLQEDEPDVRTVCKVVATHPKTPIHASRIDGVTGEGEPSDAVKAKSKLLGELSSSFSAIKLKPVNNLGDFQKKQSASDLKFDSMNVGEEGDEKLAENLYDNKYNDIDDIGNYNYDIKYKLNRNLDSVLDSNVVKCKVSEEPIEEDSRISRCEPQDRSNVCSQKTDEIIIDKKKYVQNGNGVFDESGIEDFEEDDEERNGNAGESKSNNNNEDDDDGRNRSSIKIDKKYIDNKNVDLGSKSSLDKCAIVLKCNNNNDNNAMTPVDVSYDQSQNNVSIIPGSVRSFVKFYEIQGETSVGLNSNDHTAVVPKTKVEATENSLDNCREMNLKNIILDPTAAGMEIKNEIKYTIVARKPVIKKQQNQEPADREQIANHPSDDSDKLPEPVLSQMEITASRSIPLKLSKTDAKEAAQFHNTGSPLVTSKNIAENHQKEIETGCRRESKSRSSVTKKIGTVTSSKHNAGSGIAPRTQDGSTSAGVSKDVERSGTRNHSVPKSSTSTINEHYTFYCRV